MLKSHTSASQRGDVHEIGAAPEGEIGRAIARIKAGGASETVNVRGMRVTLCAKSKPLIEQDMPEPFPHIETAGEPLAEWLR